VYDFDSTSFALVVMAVFGSSLKTWLSFLTWPPASVHVKSASRAFQGQIYRRSRWPAQMPCLPWSYCILTEYHWRGSGQKDDRDMRAESFHVHSPGLIHAGIITDNAMISARAEVVSVNTSYQVDPCPSHFRVANPDTIQQASLLGVSSTRY